MSTAEEMAKKQRDISIAEFFEKNRHLLGFDNKRKALLTTVKEAVDNSLDACEEGRILPEVIVELVDMGNDRFRVIVEDNGPGIVKKQIPQIFAKLLYGSKFHKLSQSRGQQGIGISAAVLYAQLTTGRPVKILSKLNPKDSAYYYELHIDTRHNKPHIVKESPAEWNKEHGIKVEMDIEASYLKGFQSVDEYIKQTAIINPHITLIYTNPKSEQTIYSRVTQDLPKEPVEIKPHPYGVELGLLYRMVTQTESRTLQAFLTSEFSRVGPGTAKEICQNAALLPNTKPKEMTREQAEKLLHGIKSTKIISPPTDCISPITEELLEKGLKKEVNAEFYCATTRPPAVYRGNPFIIEAAIAYGGQLPADDTVTILRFANRVPLLYQPGACAITESIGKTNWRAYGIQQSGSSLPSGPAVILVHMASVWVPFTSEAKEALAHYPEITKEVRLALQECG
ncbi:DNA topoisomerase VI subunit B, partial [Candidatus Woesearchaeota archaeon]|nr:DNA topoisomerase VI subunit B [Candidatus Woesearchaeota archaeon]